MSLSLVTISCLGFLVENDGQGYDTTGDGLDDDESSGDEEEDDDGNAVVSLSIQPTSHFDQLLAPELTLN